MEEGRDSVAGLRDLVVVVVIVVVGLLVIALCMKSMLCYSAYHIYELHQVICLRSTDISIHDIVKYCEYKHILLNKGYISEVA